MGKTQQTHCERSFSTNVRALGQKRDRRVGHKRDIFLSPSRSWARGKRSGLSPAASACHPLSAVGHTDVIPPLSNFPPKDRMEPDKDILQKCPCRTSSTLENCVLSQSYGFCENTNGRVRLGNIMEPHVVVLVHQYTARENRTRFNGATRCNTLQHAATRCNTLQRVDDTAKYRILLN